MTNQIEELKSAKNTAKATSDSPIVSPQKVKSLEWSTLRKLAKNCGINTKGMSRQEIEKALATKRPTREDLKRVA